MRPIGTLGSVPMIGVGGANYGYSYFTDITNLKMLSSYVSGASRSAITVAGVQYQVPVGKVFRCYAIRSYGYINLGYATDSGLTTGIVTFTLAAQSFGTGVSQNGSGPQIEEFVASSYPFGVDPTGGSGGGQMSLFGYEV